MSDTPNPETDYVWDYDPGSDRARKAGCRCAVLDNRHGRGAYIDENGRRQFWINVSRAECGCWTEWGIGGRYRSIRASPESCGRSQTAAFICAVRAVGTVKRLVTLTSRMAAGCYCSRRNRTRHICQRMGQALGA